MDLSLPHAGRVLCRFSLRTHSLVGQWCLPPGVTWVCFPREAASIVHLQPLPWARRPLGLRGGGSRCRLFSSTSLGSPSVLVAHQVPSSCLFGGSPGHTGGRLWSLWASHLVVQPGSGPLAWKVSECPTESLPEVDLTRVTAVSTLGHPWAQAYKGRSPA